MLEEYAKRRYTTRGAVGLLIAAAAWPLIAQAGGWHVDGGQVTVVCPLTVGGSFEAKTTSVEGTVTPDPSKPSALSGELAVDLATLDTGISLRNRHLRDNYLEVQKGAGFERAVLSDIVLEADDAERFEGRTRFTGTLLLHGTKRPVEGEAELERSGPGVTVKASFPVTLAEFGIAEPRYLGVGVRDEVQVKVAFGAARAQAVESSR